MNTPFRLNPKSESVALPTMWRILCAALLVAASLAMPVQAEAASTFTVSGKVSTSNGPVNNGWVAFYTDCANGSTIWFGLSKGTYSATLPAGTYKVRIAPVSGTGVNSWHSAKNTCAEATTITVTGNTTANLNAIPSYTVTGTVTTSNGSVNTGTVYFYTDCDKESTGSAALSKGAYSATLPAGTYKALIEPGSGTGAAPSWHSAKNTCVEATTITVTGNTTADLTAVPGYTISGTVSSSIGAASSGEITFYQDCNRYLVASASLSNGAYSATLPAGTYKARIRQGSETGGAYSWHSAKKTCAEATAITVTGNTTANLTAIPAHTVTGTAATGNGPVSTGKVEFYADCDKESSGYVYLSKGTYSATLPSGTYKVRIEPGPGTGAVNSWHSAKKTCAAATAITVTGNTTADLTAIPGYTISGTVSSSNGPVASGYVDFYADCEAWDNGDEELMTSIWGGYYSMTLPLGSYRVEISPFERTGAVHSWHSAKKTCAEATTITVTGNTTGNTTANLTAIPYPPTYTVSGTVSSSNGPANSGWVNFYTDCDRKATGGTNLSNGTYSATLPAGTYKAAFHSSEVSSAADSWHSAKNTCAEATAITVTGNTTANLTAIPGYTVTGTVSASNGPVNTGKVYFYTDCDKGWTRWAGLSNGTYSATLPAGTYKVRIEPGSGTGAVNSWHSAEKTCAEATTITVTGNTTANLTASAGYIVNGTVTTSNGPVNSSRILFYSDCESWEKGYPAGDVDSINATYKAKLTAGIYKILIRPGWGTGAVDSWHNAKQNCAEATTITVTGNTTANLTASAGYGVSGTVSTRNGPVNTGKVMFYTDCNSRKTGSAHLSNGAYSATLPAGTYKAQISPDAGNGAVDSWHSGKRTCAEAVSITVNGSTSAHLTAIFEYSVTGTVSTSNGPVKSGLIYFHTDCASREANSVHFTNGTYSAMLPAGTYKALVVPGKGNGAIDSWHGAKANCAEATTITVTGNTTANLTAIPGHTVTGTVTSSNGPVKNGRISFYTDCDARGVDGDYLSNGTYSATLPAGTYKAFIAPGSGSGAVDSWHSAKKTCDEATTITVTGNTTLALMAAAKSAPTPTPKAQSVSFGVKKMKPTKSSTLPQSTEQGAALTWQSTTKRTCKVTGGKVKAGKRGTCGLKASAQSLPDYAAYAKTFKIKVR